MIQNLIKKSALLLLILFAPILIDSAKATMRVAAVVNDDIITALELEQRVRIAAVAGGAKINLETVQRLAPQVLRNLIDELLRVQHVTKLGISASDEEINQAFKNLADQNNMSLAQLGQLLSENGILAQSMRDQLERRLLWDKFLKRQSRREVDISEEEVDELLAQEQAMRNQTLYRIQEIFFGNDEQQAIQTLTRIRQDLENGANFEAFAKGFSQAPSAARGGEIGLIPLDQLEPSLAEAVRALSIGAVSPIVSTALGHYLLKLTEIKPPQAEAKLEAGALVSIMQLRIAASIDEEEINALLDRSEGQGCQRLEPIASSLKSQGKTANLARLNDLKETDLREPMKGIISKMQAGEISPAVRQADYWYLYSLCERVEIKQPSADEKLQQRRNAIRNRIGTAKLTVLERRIMRDLRRAAFIEIRI